MVPARIQDLFKPPTGHGPMMCGLAGPYSATVGQTGTGGEVRHRGIRPDVNRGSGQQLCQFTPCQPSVHSLNRHTGRIPDPIEVFLLSDCRPAGHHHCEARAGSRPPPAHAPAFIRSSAGFETSDWHAAPHSRREARIVAFDAWHHNFRPRAWMPSAPDRRNRSSTRCNSLSVVMLQLSSHDFHSDFPFGTKPEPETVQRLLPAWLGDRRSASRRRYRNAATVGKNNFIISAAPGRCDMAITRSISKLPARIPSVPRNTSMSMRTPGMPCRKARTSGVVNRTSPSRRVVTTSTRGFAESLISVSTMSLSSI